jgi:hypothetical protein
MQGDVIGCKVDFTQSPSSMSFTVNGADKGMAFSLPDHMKGRSSALFPAIAVKASAAAVNFGGSPFQHPPPGYVAISRLPAEALTTGAYPTTPGHLRTRTA